MKKKVSFTLNLLIFLLVLAQSLSLCSKAVAAGPIIVNHTCIDINQIPEAAINKAKSDLHIAYAHTSHGSQLISGMGGSGTSNALNTFLTDNPAYPNYSAGLCRWVDDNGAAGSTSGYLDLDDRFVSGDLGNPNRTTWASRTRTYLGNPINDTANPNYGRGNTRPEVNVIIWSWCGQASTSITNIDIYLNLMEELISDYPNVQFVFMTGHLNGTGAGSTLNLANEHIRNHCITNGRILYDFADIESYDPDGLVNYMELMATDNCDYDSNGNGSRDKNWASDWQRAHTQNRDWWASSAAHSQHLNGNLKGYAAWWLWAKLAGWGECLSAPSALTAASDSINHQVILEWADNSTDINENSFIIQRQVDGGSWDDNYATIQADTTTYTDTGLAIASYNYRIVARLNDDGTGVPCDSGFSNETLANIANEEYTIILQQGVNGYTGCNDTYLDLNHPYINYGNTHNKDVLNNPKCNLLISFELPPEVIGKKILEAKLTFDCGSVKGWSTGQYLDLYRVTEGWEEATTTWNLKNSGNNWTNFGGSFDPALLDSSLIPDGGYYPEFSITGLVQDWADNITINYGVLLKNDSIVDTAIRGSEYSESGRPSLEITYAHKLPCNTDFDVDGDVDGLDLAYLASAGYEDYLDQFVLCFGK